MWRVGSAANSSTLYSARELFFCSFIGLADVFVEIHLQRNERSCHHALASKKREDQLVVAREHGPDFPDACAPEACANRFQQARADPGQTGTGLDIDPEDPAASLRAE